MQNLETNAQFISLKKTFESSSVPFAALDKDFKLSYMNPAFLSQFPEFENPLTFNYVIKDLDEQTVRNHLISEKTYTVNLKFPSLDCAKVNLNAILDENGEFIGAAAFVTEIPDEISLFKNNGNLQTENINHEFRDRLSMIFSCIYALSKSPEFDNTPKLWDYVNGINQNCYQLIRVSDNLSKILRLSENNDKANFKLIDFSSFLEKLVNAVIKLDNKNQIPISLKVNSGIYTAMVDIPRMEFAIVNIILNSIKYTRDGNKISLELSQVGDNAVLKISDLGAGISIESLKKLGTPYYTDSHNGKFEVGFGVGLYITKKYIASHGGFFSISSEENVGTDVTVSIPLSLENKDKKNLILNSPPEFNPEEKFSQTAIQLSEVCYYPVL